MATFQKPESALKRAEELLAIDKPQNALETLHAALQHKKFKNLWTSTIESIMIKHLQLCVDLKQMRTAREGLYQYRTMCQAANSASLEDVVKKFRHAAEEKVKEAQRQQETRLADMADLDLNESPETILLRAIQASDTRQTQDRDVHIHYRFCWDAYKVVLDVLKSNAKMEDCYHETAKHAFIFCKTYERPQEFKRLCDTLRKNYQDLHKHTGSKVAQHQVNPNHPDTIGKTLETRMEQLDTATKLNLWRESYITAGEIHELMPKATKKGGQIRSSYYDNLAKIFWKSENYLFHAFACVKNLMFVKASAKSSEEHIRKLASKALLATLCVPFQKDSDMQSSLELTTDGTSSAFEKAKKHAALFSAQSVPTRESICSMLLEKGLLQLSPDACQKLFALVESEFTPLSLCNDAKPYLDEIAKGELFEGELVQYVTPLKQIIFFRLMKQLSEVYSNMTIKNFENAASIVPFNIAEKWMANAARSHGINIQIDYQHQAIVFGAPRKVDMKSMRQPLMEMGYKLQTAMNRVAPEESGKKERHEKKQLYSSLLARIEEEGRIIRQRKDEIERRKEESERKRQEKEKEALEKQRRQDAIDAEEEKIRQERDRKKREAERAEQKRKEAEMLKNKEMLEQMKKQADSSKNSKAVKVGGKKITEIEADDLENIGIDQIEKAREEQVLRERQEKIRNRKMESKRVDHLARALREEEIPQLQSWIDDVEDQDYVFLQKAEERNMEEQRKKHEENLKERDVMVVFSKAKDGWTEARMEDRYADFEDKRDAQVRRLTQKIVDGKIARAKQRLEQYEQEQKQMKDDAERRKADEERRRKEEERRAREEAEAAERREQEELEAEERREAEEKRRREAEEKRREMDEQRQRAEAKRLQREKEIEERQAAERAQPRGDRREDDRRGDDRRGDDRRGDDRRGDDDMGSWRRQERPAAPADREGGSGGGASAAPWRRSGTGNVGDRAPGGGRQDDEGGSWRRPAAAPRDDDRDAGPPRGEARGGGAARDDDKWRRGPPPESDRDRAPARAPARDGGNEGGAWRRPADRTPGGGGGEEGGAWRRPADRTPGGGGGGKEGAWRPGGDRPAPARDSREDDGPRRAAPAQREPPAREPAPAPAADNEDEGWSTATAGKRRGAKPSGGRADEDNWRRGPPAGGSAAPVRGGDAGRGGGGGGGGARGDDGGNWRSSGGPRGSGSAPAGGDNETRPVPPWKRPSANRQN